MENIRKEITIRQEILHDLVEEMAGIDEKQDKGNNSQELVDRYFELGARASDVREELEEIETNLQELADLAGMFI